jgi:hypothetical protein
MPRTTTGIGSVDLQDRLSVAMLVHGCGGTAQSTKQTNEARTQWREVDQEEQTKHCVAVPALLASRCQPARHATRDQTDVAYQLTPFSSVGTRGKGSGGVLGCSSGVDGSAGSAAGPGARCSALQLARTEDLRCGKQRARCWARGAACTRRAEHHACVATMAQAMADKQLV